MLYAVCRMPRAALMFDVSLAAGMLIAACCRADYNADADVLRAVWQRHMEHG